MQVEIDEIWLQAIRQLAEEQGRSEEEVLQDAVRLYVQLRRVFLPPDSPTPDFSGISGEVERGDLRPQPIESFGDLFAWADRWQREQGVEPLSDEEAMELANEELHAMRRERKASR